MFWTFSFWLFHRMGSVSTCFLRSGSHKGGLNSEVIFAGDHTKIVSHISQDNALTGFENVQARQAFSWTSAYGGPGVSSGELDQAESELHNKVPPKAGPSSRRLFIAGLSSESELMSSTSFASRRSRTSLARNCRAATVAELSSSSCPL